MREKIIKYFLKDPPCGDLWDWPHHNNYKVSCVFIFYERIDLMKNILKCLDSQDFTHKSFEVILVEDRGGSEAGKSLKEKFHRLNISYFSPSHHWGKMGYMRNYGLSKAGGEIVLFLDDDTVIFDQSFLTKLYHFFEHDRNLMAIIPRGNASYSLIKNHYAFHDPFFFTNRCMAYRRTCLIDLRGFDSSFIGQEDVELAIRFLAKDYKYMKHPGLEYHHPPLVVNDTGKAMAVGLSFARSKYNPTMKFILLINGARWLPRYLLFNPKNRYLGRFGLGFAKGFFKGFFTNNKELGYS